MKRLVALAAALLLAGCATANVPQTIEKVDADAASAYAAVALAADAAETAFPAKAPQAEAIKVEAWNLFKTEHAAYLAGQSVNIQALLNLVATAKAL